MRLWILGGIAIGAGISAFLGASWVSANSGEVLAEHRVDQLAKRASRSRTHEWELPLNLDAAMAPLALDLRAARHEDLMPATVIAPDGKELRADARDSAVGPTGAVERQYFRNVGAGTHRVSGRLRDGNAQVTLRVRVRVTPLNLVIVIGGALLAIGGFGALIAALHRTSSSRLAAALRTPARRRHGERGNISGPSDVDR